MPQGFSVRYIILFSLAICGVCAVFVSSLAVSLAEAQDANKLIDRRKNVLMAAGEVESGQKLPPEEINRLFADFKAVVIDLSTGEEVDIDPDTFDQRKERNDPERSSAAPTNNAGVKRMPHHALVYKKINTEEQLEMLILPVEGYGLWSTLYGFLALDEDLKTIQGLAYYEHTETPGLGGEVENPRWRALWPGRQAYDENWNPAIEVIKGPAGPVEDDPYRVDGLSGATITARGVSGMMELWLGENGFKPYIDNLRKGAA
ncbi:MAG: Na(+)-translocating NADH-quinone reductase subunit C [Acidobacteriota bacterium]